MIMTIISMTGCQTSASQREVVRRITTQYEREMKTGYGLNILHNNAVCESKFKKFIMDFYHFEESEVLEARYLIHRCAEDLLKKLNSQAYLSSCFENFPLTEKDIEISISFLDPKTHKRHEDDRLSHVSLLNGQIYYSTFQSKTQMLEKTHQEEFVSRTLAK